MCIYFTIYAEKFAPKAFYKPKKERHFKDTGQDETDVNVNQIKIKLISSGPSDNSALMEKKMCELYGAGRMKHMYE